MKLILLFARLFPAALPSQRLFYTLLLSGLQVEGMTFYFLNYVFLLNLALETSESVFEGLTLLKPDFSQTNYTPKLVQNGPNSYCKVKQSSQAQCQNFRQRKATRVASAAFRYCSEGKPQCNLDLSRSIRVRRFQKVGRLSVVTGEMADSNDLFLC